VNPGQKIGLKDRRGWKPAIALLAEWRRANASPPIPASLVIADEDGRPTPAFRGLWQAAFGEGLPLDLVMIEAERQTRAFIDRWEHVT